LHPKSKRIHIGADEAFHIAEDDRCRIRLAKMGEKDRLRAVEKLKLAHIARVAQLGRKVGFSEVLAWNDMFDKSEVVDMKTAGLGELITPVVWGYRLDVTEKGYFPEHLFERLSQVFPTIFFASAFKGANSEGENFIDIDRYFQNQMSYVKLYRENRKALDGRVDGIILTGWQRYRHYAPLCELLAISLPSLITDLVYFDDVTRHRDEVWNFVKVRSVCFVYAFYGLV
uniref:Exostosin domain-containing protein n=1 Tax=Angiostrongylus cantonensis TaxID=6313 RepID=A0A0K0CUZ4_ANGCA